MKRFGLLCFVEIEIFLPRSLPRSGEEGGHRSEGARVFVKRGDLLEGDVGASPPCVSSRMKSFIVSM